MYRAGKRRRWPGPPQAPHPRWGNVVDPLYRLEIPMESFIERKRALLLVLLAEERAKQKSHNRDE
jgi:hypothetical protein